MMGCTGDMSREKGNNALEWIELRYTQYSR
jgi:hypothetical protein